MSQEAGGAVKSSIELAGMAFSTLGRSEREKYNSDAMALLLLAWSPVMEASFSSKPN